MSIVANHTKAILSPQFYKLSWFDHSTYVMFRYVYHLDNEPHPNAIDSKRLKHMYPETKMEKQDEIFNEMKPLA